jgi:hypothetical protein
VFERLSGGLERQRNAAAATDWQDFLDADRAFHAVTREMRMIGESALREPDRITTIMDEHRGTPKHCATAIAFGRCRPCRPVSGSRISAKRNCVSKRASHPDLGAS